MPVIEKVVPAPELVGTKGYPRHFEAYGIPAPTKVIQVLVDGDGNEFVEGPPDGGPVPHPPLTRRQLRLGLLQAGITTAQVEAAIEAIPDEMEREVARIEWADATSYERDHQLVDQIGDALGLTHQQIDTMWADAAAL